MEDGEAEIPDIPGVLIISQWILSDKSLWPHLPRDQGALFGIASCWPAHDGREVAKILQEQLRQLASARKRNSVHCLWPSHPWLLHSQSTPQALSVDLENPVMMPKNTGA